MLANPVCCHSGLGSGCNSIGLDGASSSRFSAVRLLGRSRRTHSAEGLAHRAKADGRQRPIAVAAIEDKIVQRAVTALLNAIYEEDFLGFSYGFRPGRGA